MKLFDLEKALAGEPVVLRDGSKATIFYNLNQTFGENASDFPLQGVLNLTDGYISSVKTWTINGSYRGDNIKSDEDIIGMWEEPRPTVTLTLPCPLKNPQKGMWFLNNDFKPTKSNYYQDTNKGAVSQKIMEQGLYFASEEDAQAWLDAFKNSRR